MCSNYLKAAVKAAILAVTILLLTAGVSSAQTAATVSLTASQQTVTMPDGAMVPMWGWTCGDSVTGGVASVNATCTALTYTTPAGTVAATTQKQLGGPFWQPPLIVVPYNPLGTTLAITLNNSLPVETSIMILGQVGGGLGGSNGFTAGTTASTGPVREAVPRSDGAHAGQTATTWTIVVPGSFTPPSQENRVRSLVPEIAGVATTGTLAASGTYTWGTATPAGGLKPGTYLIRTGTYPSIQGPMGLYGVLVVTTAPVAGGAAGTAYYPPTGSPATAAGVTYDADVVALESEIDPRQNRMVAALFPTACTGVGTPVAGCTAAGAALPAGTATANAGFSETAKWNITCGAGLNGLTSNGTLPTCYPPAVDYTPLYFLINGVAFSKDNQLASALEVPAPSAAPRGNVLIRYVNAGSRMHVPVVNGLDSLLVAEDAFVDSDVALALGWSIGSSGTAPAPKTLSANLTTIGSSCLTTATVACGLHLRTEVFQPAGKVFDVIVSPGAVTAATTYVISDRSLALGSGGLAAGSGMTAILDVADSGGAAVAAANSTATVAGAAYTYVPGVTLVVADPGKGVLKGDANVYGVQLVAGQVGHGTLTLNANGTFTYFNAANNGDTFNFYANGNAALAGAVTFTAANTAGTAPTANGDSYTSKSSTLLRIAAPGVLGNDSDPNHLPLCAVATVAAAGSPTLCPMAVQTIAGTGVNVSLNSDGSFTAQLTGAAPAAGATAAGSFTYYAANSQGTPSNQATVNLTFQGGSGLKVLVKDAVTGAVITDYKWIIEQDLTYQIDPACQVNTGALARPVQANGRTCPAGIPPTPATNFHASYMPVIAEGCTGAQSCEKGQTVYVPCISPGNPANCGQHVLAACDGYGTCTIGALQLPASTPDSANLNAANPDGSPAQYYISILSGDAQNAFAYANTKDPSVAGNCTPGQNGNPATEPTGITEASACGHTMGGAPVPSATSFVGGTCTVATGTGGPGTTYSSCSYPAPAAGTGNVTINLQPQPLPTATVTAFIFEDDYPLNGEPDTGGGIDALATLEKPLGDFQIQIWDDAGGVGDFTGQMTYDMFNMPLSNALNGTIDPNTGFDACPLAPTVNTGATNQTQTGTGQILVCPQFESDGKTPSPLTGQVVVRNLMMGKFSLIAHPGANREAQGEEWLQTNSLDGGHFLDSFIKPGEPPYFTEFGPGGYHVFFGFANPKHINKRLADICGGNLAAGGASTPFQLPCNNTLNGQVANLHQNRPPDENLYNGGVFAQGDPRNYAMLGYTNCYAAIGDTDGATIALAKCDPDGNFSFTGLPKGDFGLVLFDQWNDFIVDGSSHAITLPDPATGSTTVTKMYPSFTWQAHLWSRIYMDTTGQGSPNLLPDGSLDPATSPGLIQVPTRIRQTNGKVVNTLLSDIGGNMRFDETFPLFAFYSVESDNTRFRTTGVHVVNDHGGQVDGPAAGGGNGNTGPFQGILNSKETFSLPIDLSVPGAVYCSSGNAACLGSVNASDTLLGSPAGKASCGKSTDTTATAPCQSTGRIDPGRVDVEGWQGGVSEFNMIDWGKQPYYVSPTGAAENGGIRGRVVNNTTRNFDDIRMQIQNLWEPLVPRVQMNLYIEGFAASDGVTPTLTLVDSTTTDSFDDWAQGFHAPAGSPAGTPATIPNMSCTGQDPADPFFSYTMSGSANLLNPGTALPYNSQYKCYDGYHNLNQIQPAPYDGQFRFPSPACATGLGAAPPTFMASLGGSETNPVLVTCNTIPNPAVNPATGAPVTDPVTHAVQTGAAQRILPPGTYVVEIKLPPGLQLDKEEDLNLLIGDQYIAPATSQFTGLGNIYITPDQASLDSPNPSYTGPYTASNPYCPPFANPAPVGCTTGANSTTNNGKQSTDYGRTTFGVFAPGGLQLQSAPCVGKMRIVPDFLSIAPESGEVSPFAGSLRPLCDRKELIVSNQMQADVEFNTYTHTPKTTSFTGFISDDFSSEFDPASPAFGEKFAVPNVPVSIKDFNGNEVSRVYSDQWGVFNGLVYSSWEVDPPNITGFSPNMMVTCMNDPGPFVDHRPTILNPNTAAGQPATIPNPTYGQMISDPLYNPAYSTFCYENPFMPGDVTYLDTPVVPVSAFAEGYNPPDCSYPDGTPMILSVKGSPIPGAPAGAAGPWVAATGNSITICALAPTTPAAAGSGCPTSSAGMQAPNNAYSGPAASTSPYNQKTVTRHYGFGNSAGTVTIGGQPCVLGTWSDAAITCQVPALPLATAAGTGPCSELPQTSVANGAQTAERCGELVIRTGGPAASQKESIDTVTVTQFTATTIGGKHNPVFVAGEDATGHALQNAIDSANPGDLVIVGCPAGQFTCTYNEMLLMWKPIRLQGIGDGAVTINANAHPAGKLLEPWRRQVNCLFGLALNGGVVTAGNPYDPTGQFTNNCPVGMANQVDGLVGEALVGWDATLNGNLAELLQEPTLMGAYEGAGITVLAKGLENGGPNSATCNVETPATCIPLNNGRATVISGQPSDCNYQSMLFPSNFQCNPSRVDGFTFTNSSQGGGGIFLHGFNHFMQVSNNYVTGNGGTLTGGITLGQMETIEPNTASVTVGVGAAAYTATIQLPLGYNQNLNVHNNRVTNNAAYGDELNSNTPASGGGVTICTGADNYNFNHNWICGNWSSGDGGGVAAHGFSWNGTIQNNWILFNQSINPSLVTNGGGLVVQGFTPDGTLGEAGTAGDVDVAPALSTGIGPGLTIRNNVFQGNTAEEGQGGGMSMMHISGTDIANNPAHPGSCGGRQAGLIPVPAGSPAPVGTGELWYCVTVVDNIFANNVAGWTGGGVSLLDAVLVDFHNNTVVSNDSTASAGVVFNSNGAPLGNVPPPGCNPVDFGNNCNTKITQSHPLPAGLVSQKHSGLLSAVFTNASPCPLGHDTTPATNACRGFSVPSLDRDIFFQNRSFSIGTSPTVNAHNAVVLLPTLSQASTGACPAEPAFSSSSGGYWDVGVYGDTTPTTAGAGNPRLTITSSTVSSGNYPSAGAGANSTDLPGSGQFGRQFCNGSRVAPEIATLLCTTNANGNANAPGCISNPGAVGIQTNGGVPDAAIPPNPLFTISPAATIDEGNNWINMFYGPLSLTCAINTTAAGCGAGPASGPGAAPFNAPLGDYTAPTGARGAAIKSNLPTYPNP